MPFTVLIVCTGNTCRSAMAEGILRSLLAEAGPVSVDVESAGTGGLPGMPASRHAQEVCLERGVDIGAHASRELTPEALGRADLVLAMTRSHADRASSLSPDAKERTFLLSGFAEGKEFDVPDPMGAPKGEYERAYDLMADYLSKAAPKIVRLAGGEEQMTISVASDHAGYELKEAIREHLTEAGYQVVDFGTDSTESTDYPDYATPAARAVARGDAEKGVLVCGSGQGMVMTANKVKGVRAALAWHPDVASLSRKHNDANVLALPARFVSVESALEIVDAWLEAEFEGGRHIPRVEKMMKAEEDEPWQI